MSDANKSPVPENGSRLPRLTWVLLWRVLALLAVGVSAAAGLATKYVYATKSEVADVVAGREKVAADLAVQTELRKLTDEHQDQAIGEIKADVKDLKAGQQVVDANIRTLMLEIEIPREKIMRSPAHKER